MSLFGNYNTPGRGVLKAPQEKKGIFKFFEVYGRHMWKLMELNLLYFVFCIPLTLMVILMLMTSNPIWLLLAIPSVLIGPATAAMTKVCRNSISSKETWQKGGRAGVRRQESAENGQTIA